jgi:hypothetical protein
LGVGKILLFELCISSFLLNTEKASNLSANRCSVSRLGWKNSTFLQDDVLFFTLLEMLQRIRISDILVVKDYRLTVTDFTVI